MTLILQIFRKDVRHLAPFLLALFALQTVFAIGTIHSVGLVDLVDSENRLEVTLGFIETLLFVCWALLIALVVLEDPPVGDNAFWLTRPYSWRSLLAAKILFVFAFLNLPLLISDCVILKSLNLPFSLGHLFLRQFPLLALVIIPVFAFASISNRLSQFWLFLVIILVAMAVELFALYQKLPDGLDFIKTPDTGALLSAFLCAALAIVLQFARQPAFTRIWLVASFSLLALLIVTTTHLFHNGYFSFTTHSAPATSNQWQEVHLEVGRGESRQNKPSELWDGHWLGLRIPIRVQGLSTDAVLSGEGETFLDRSAISYHSVLEHATDGRHSLSLMKFVTEANSDVRISIRSSLQIWVLNNRPTYQKALKPLELVNIENIGICQYRDGNKIICWDGPLRSPAVTIATNSWAEFFSPHFSDNSDDDASELLWDFSPIEKRRLNFDSSNKTHPGDQFSFTPHFLIGSFHRDLRSGAFPLFEATPFLNVP